MQGAAVLLYFWHHLGPDCAPNGCYISWQIILYFHILIFPVCWKPVDMQAKTQTIWTLKAKTRLSVKFESHYLFMLFFIPEIMHTGNINRWLEFEPVDFLLITNTVSSIKHTRSPLCGLQYQMPLSYVEVSTFWGPSKRIVAQSHALLHEYLNISEPSTAPEAGVWWWGQHSLGLLKNFQLFHQVSEDTQHLFDFISGGLHGLWVSQCCWCALHVAQAAAQTAPGNSSLVDCSNWVNSITLIRISECVYIQDEK